MQKTLPLEDLHQNFWQLACLRSVIGITDIILGWQIANVYGAKVAIPSICIGNLILWITGIGITSMTKGKRNDGIQNIKAYLGKTGAIIASVILLVAIVTWYVFQLNTATTALSSFFESYKFWHQDTLIRIGAAFGLLIALLSIGGIRLIKWSCMIAIPFMIGFIAYTIARSEHSTTLSGTWGLSFFAIITVVAISLPGMVYLPTFFRHSRSKADSFLALSIVTVVVSFFQISGIFFGSADPMQYFLAPLIDQGIGIDKICTLLFIILCLISVNLVNIYVASAGWEEIIPHHWSRKEYVIIGLISTATYTFIQLREPIELLENMMDNFIWTLAIVLSIDYLLKITIKYRTRSFERHISNTCWFFGAVIGSIMLIYNPQAVNESVIAGICASLVVFMIVILYEETIWALNYKLTEKKSTNLNRIIKLFNKKNS